jgi:hypothetical protein
MIWGSPTAIRNGFKSAKCSRIPAKQPKTAALAMVGNLKVNNFQKVFFAY